MIDLNKEELANIAKLSGLKISEAESDQLIKDLKILLEFSQSLINLEIGPELEANKNVNVFREDKVYAQDFKKFTEIFQQKEDNFLVVPKVLD